MVEGNEHFLIRRLADLVRNPAEQGKRSVKDACRRSSPGVMMAAWQRQQRKCPLSA
jgi:hypothetical protein